MPRIRTLKPEHKAHRKVGRLDDGQYRLWVGMLTETDDAGRLVAEVGQLRALVWPYHDISLEDVEKRLLELAKLRLIRLYTVKGTRYAVFPSFFDHQRLDRPSPSKLPQPPRHIVHECSPNDRRGLDDGSATPRRGSKGIEPKRNETNRTEDDSTMAHAMGSNADPNHTPETAPLRVRQEQALPEWFNSCPEGRIRRACVKTEFLDRFPGAIQCAAHAKARQDLGR